MKTLLTLICILTLAGCDGNQGLKEQRSEVDTPIEASDPKFKNAYDLFRSIDTSYPEFETSTRTMGTLGTSAYMATTKIFQSDVSNNEIKKLVENLKADLIESFQGKLYSVMTGGPSGKNNDLDHFDIMAEGPEYQLFLAVDYTPDFVLVTLVHNPKELNQSR